MTSPLSLPRLLTLGLSLALVVALCSCGQSPEIDQDFMILIDPKLEAPDRSAREFIESLRSGRITDAIQQVDTTLQNDEGKPRLQSLSSLFKGAGLQRLECIGAQYETAHPSSVKLIYRMKLDSGWFTGNVVVTESPTGLQISAVDFTPISSPVGRLHAFSFENGALTRYVILFLSGLNVVIIAAVTVLCALSKVRKKGLWLVCILFGILTVKLNWKPPANTQVPPVSLGLLGVTFPKAPWAAWVLSFNLPVGALVFLSKRKKLVAQSSSELPAV